MGIVRREQEASRQQFQIPASVRAKALRNPPEDILQKCGVRPLPGGASHLLVVKHRAYIDISAGTHGFKSPEGRKSTLQIVQSGRQHKLSVLAQDAAFLPDIQKQVVPQNILPLTARRLRHGFQQSAAFLFPLLLRKQGQHIHLGIIFHAVVHVPVHVDCQIGNHQQILIQIDQPGLYSVLPLHGHTARHGEGAVHPGRKDHCPVLFRVQCHIMPFHTFFRRLLQLEAGGVAV
ncbi:hypothetical protein IMSAG185_02069 [Lachnospiraceae bacterium]|nr:hypothetical protein IMSAG185_02069 [Lachnospiraceae bacterium]